MNNMFKALIDDKKIQKQGKITCWKDVEIEKGDHKSCKNKMVLEHTHVNF